MKENISLVDTPEYKLAQTIENAINNLSFDNEIFAQAITHFHPTLQQNFFRLIRSIVRVQANNDRIYDGRNKASHELAVKLMPIIDEFPLPYI